VTEGGPGAALEVGQKVADRADQEVAVTGDAKVAADMKTTLQIGPSNGLITTRVGGIFQRVKVLMKIRRIIQRRKWLRLKRL